LVFVLEGCFMEEKTYDMLQYAVRRLVMRGKAAIEEV
jgi:hypothetical protein